jgi:glycosyltransferase involved in cell wall biosynthesis
MIKNENDIIDRFISYHMELCDKFFLIDHGSTDGTLEKIKKYSDKYSTKIIAHEYRGHFRAKGRIISELMKKSNSSILLPIDTDEIICYEDNDGQISFDQHYIKQYLNTLHKLYNHGKFKVKQIYNYIPNTDSWFDIDTSSQKMFFLSSDFVSVDDGFHKGITKTNKTINSNISYLHFHYRSKESWLKSTEQKLKVRLGDKWNDLSLLEQYKKPRPSFHVALEYSKYLSTGQWHNLQPKKYIDTTNL